MENGWFHLTCLKCRTRITKLLSQIITESRLEIGPQLYPAVWKYEHFTNSLTFIVVSNKIWLNIAMQFNLIIYVCSSWWDLSINYFNNSPELIYYRTVKCLTAIGEALCECVCMWKLFDVLLVLLMTAITACEHRYTHFSCSILLGVLNGIPFKTEIKCWKCLSFSLCLSDDITLTSVWQTDVSQFSFIDEAFVSVFVR